MLPIRAVIAVMCGLAIVIAISTKPAPLSAEADSDEWRAYGGNKTGDKYSPLDQIDKNTVKNLKIVWRQSATPLEVREGHANAPVPTAYEHTPLMADGLLYMSTGYGTVAALDPGTGDVKWYDSPFKELPQAGAGGTSSGPSERGSSNRSLAYWTDGKDARVIAIVGALLVALNVKTGERYPTFGNGGVVDLSKDHRRSPDGGFRWGGPAIVVRDVIIVGGFPNGANDIVTEMAKARMETPPGDIRGYDVRTGKLLWTFHTVPEPGEFGNETWLKDSWSYSGNTGVWGSMSGDEELGYVYLPLETPTGDYYGGTRPGNNLFAESLVCLDARTGKRIWHFQAIHHGLWDYDFTSPPVLSDIVVDGRRIKAVAEVSKQGFVYVFDRVTGRPVWPIQERPVPKGDVPGEWYSPTQPIPTKPPAFEQQGVSIDDLVNFTPELRRQAMEIVSKYKYGPLFTPFGVPGTPSGKDGTILMPSSIGGANWPGAGLDPETGTLYVPSVRAADIIQLVKSEHPESNIPFVRRNAFRSDGWLSGPQGLPTPFKPPYGSLTAIDLNKGEITWKVANGDGPRDLPALQGLNLPRLGQQGRVGPLVTKSLVFLGEGADRLVYLPPGAGGKMFRAYDKATGQVVWETQLPGGTTGNPMTYLFKGKQFIVVAVGWSDMPAELIALGLQ